MRLSDVGVSRRWAGTATRADESNAAASKAAPPVAHIRSVGTKSSPQQHQHRSGTSPQMQPRENLTGSISADVYLQERVAKNLQDWIITQQGINLRQNKLNTNNRNNDKDSSNYIDITDEKSRNTHNNVNHVDHHKQQNKLLLKCCRTLNRTLADIYLQHESISVRRRIKESGDSSNCVSKDGTRSDGVVMTGMLRKPTVVGVLLNVRKLIDECLSSNTSQNQNNDQAATSTKQHQQQSGSTADEHVDQHSTGKTSNPNSSSGTDKHELHGGCALYERRSLSLAVLRMLVLSPGTMEIVASHEWASVLDSLCCVLNFGNLLLPAEVINPMKLLLLHSGSPSAAQDADDNSKRVTDGMAGDEMIIPGVKLSAAEKLTLDHVTQLQEHVFACTLFHSTQQKNALIHRKIQMQRRTRKRQQDNDSNNPKPDNDDTLVLALSMLPGEPDLVQRALRKLLVCAALMTTKYPPKSVELISIMRSFAQLLPLALAGAHPTQSHHFPPQRAHSMALVLQDLCQVSLPLITVLHKYSIISFLQSFLHVAGHVVSLRYALGLARYDDAEGAQSLMKKKSPAKGNGDASSRIDVTTLSNVVPDFFKMFRARLNQLKHRLGPLELTMLVSQINVHIRKEKEFLQVAVPAALSPPSPELTITVQQLFDTTCEICDRCTIMQCHAVLSSISSSAEHLKASGHVFAMFCRRLVVLLKDELELATQMDPPKGDEEAPIAGKCQLILIAMREVRARIDSMQEDATDTADSSSSLATTIFLAEQVEQMATSVLYAPSSNAHFFRLFGLLIRRNKDPLPSSAPLSTQTREVLTRSISVVSNVNTLFGPLFEVLRAVVEYDNSAINGESDKADDAGDGGTQEPESSSEKQQDESADDEEVLLKKERLRAAFPWLVTEILRRVAATLQQQLLTGADGINQDTANAMLGVFRALTMLHNIQSRGACPDELQNAIRVCLLLYATPISTLPSAKNADEAVVTSVSKEAVADVTSTLQTLMEKCLVIVPVASDHVLVTVLRAKREQHVQSTGMFNVVADGDTPDVALKHNDANTNTNSHNDNENTKNDTTHDSSLTSSSAETTKMTTTTCIVEDWLLHSSVGAERARSIVQQWRSSLCNKLHNQIKIILPLDQQNKETPAFLRKSSQKLQQQWQIGFGKACLVAHVISGMQRPEEFTQMCVKPLIQPALAQPSLVRGLPFHPLFKFVSFLTMLIETDKSILLQKVSDGGVLENIYVSLTQAVTDMGSKLPVHFVVNLIKNIERLEVLCLSQSEQQSGGESGQASADENSGGNSTERNTQVFAFTEKKQLLLEIARRFQANSYSKFFLSLASKWSVESESVWQAFIHGGVSGNTDTSPGDTGTLTMAAMGTQITPDSIMSIALSAKSLTSKSALAAIEKMIIQGVQGYRNLDDPTTKVLRMQLLTLPVCATLLQQPLFSDHLTLPVWRAANEHICAAMEQREAELLRNEDSDGRIDDGEWPDDSFKTNVLRVLTTLALAVSRNVDGAAAEFDTMINTLRPLLPDLLRRHTGSMVPLVHLSAALGSGQSTGRRKSVRDVDERQKRHQEDREMFDAVLSGVLRIAEETTQHWIDAGRKQKNNDIPLKYVITGVNAICMWAATMFTERLCAEAPRLIRAVTRVVCEIHGVCLNTDDAKDSNGGATDDFSLLLQISAKHGKETFGIKQSYLAHLFSILNSLLGAFFTQADSRMDKTDGHMQRSVLMIYKIVGQLAPYHWDSLAVWHNAISVFHVQTQKTQATGDQEVQDTLVRIVDVCVFVEVKRSLILSGKIYPSHDLRLVALALTFAKHALQRICSLSASPHGTGNTLSATLVNDEMLSESQSVPASPSSSPQQGRDHRLSAAVQRLTRIVATTKSAMMQNQSTDNSAMLEHRSSWPVLPSLVKAIESVLASREEQLHSRFQGGKKIISNRRGWLAQRSRRLLSIHNTSTTHQSPDQRAPHDESIARGSEHSDDKGTRNASETLVVEAVARMLMIVDEIAVSHLRQAQPRDILAILTATEQPSFLLSSSCASSAGQSSQNSGGTIGADDLLPMFFLRLPEHCVALAAKGQLSRSTKDRCVRVLGTQMGILTNSQKTSLLETCT